MAFVTVPKGVNPSIMNSARKTAIAVTALCKWPQPHSMDTVPEDTAKVAPEVMPEITLEVTPAITPNISPEVWVDTAVEAHESLEKSITSVQAIFPDWIPGDYEPKATFPRQKQRTSLTAEVSNIDKLLELCSSQRILDTALDAMTMDRSEDAVMFQLGRQAALAGKISFVLTGERALGGVMQVTMVGEGVIGWLEEATWHSGRNDIPRLVGDELRMDHAGEPVEWFDNAGRPTFYSDELD